ncbi:Unknown protein, partial [Striga hermonthica]
VILGRSGNVTGNIFLVGIGIGDMGSKHNHTRNRNGACGARDLKPRDKRKYTHGRRRCSPSPRGLGRGVRRRAGLRRLGQEAANLEWGASKRIGVQGKEDQDYYS